MHDMSISPSALECRATCDFGLDCRAVALMRRSAAWRVGSRPEYANRIQMTKTLIIASDDDRIALQAPRPLAPSRSAGPRPVST